jgi:hypothetical protein
MIKCYNISITACFLILLINLDVYIIYMCIIIMCNIELINIICLSHRVYCKYSSNSHRVYCKYSSSSHRVYCKYSSNSLLVFENHDVSTWYTYLVLDKIWNLCVVFCRWVFVILSIFFGLCIVCSFFFGIL